VRACAPPYSFSFGVSRRKPKNAMAPIIFPTAYEVEVRGTYFGQQCENVWHVIGADPFDPAMAADIAATFHTSYAGILAALSRDLFINEVFVHNFDGASSGEFTLAITPAEQGEVVQDGLPGNVAFCVSLRTALAGRSTRGRKYFAGLGEGDVSGNEFDGGRIATLLTGVNDLIANLVTNGTPLAIFSRTIPALTQVQTATAVDAFVDSQRRRLTGRGR